MTDKRFLLFAFDTYYPCGGIFDMVDSFDTLEEARSASEKLRRDCSHIYDRVVGEEVV